MRPGTSFDKSGDLTSSGFGQKDDCKQGSLRMARQQRSQFPCVFLGARFRPQLMAHQCKFRDVARFGAPDSEVFHAMIILFCQQQRKLEVQTTGSERVADW
jgi:hypothetical protein